MWCVLSYDVLFDVTIMIAVSYRLLLFYSMQVVEIKLRHLDQVQQAFDLVREMASSEGATLVANYCLEVQNYRGAIEFFLMAKKSEEAFKLAQSHSQVDIYAELLGENIPAEDALKVASYYEKAQDFGKAGK